MKSMKTWAVIFIVCSMSVWHVAPATEAFGGLREQIIPILGVTMNTKPIGTVANLLLSFQEREDHQGLIVQFRTAPGRFSRMAQTATQQAIYRAAHAAGLKPDSWTVILSVPYP